MLRLAKTFELLAAALERLSIPYAVVGSVASSARGSYRATEDIDVFPAKNDFCAAQLEHATSLPIAALGPATNNSSPWRHGDTEKNAKPKSEPTELAEAREGQGRRRYASFACESGKLK